MTDEQHAKQVERRQRQAENRERRRNGETVIVRPWQPEKAKRWNGPRDISTMPPPRDEKPSTLEQWADQILARAPVAKKRRK